MKHLELLIKKIGPLLIIVIIAVFFRLYNIQTTPPGFYPDEAIYANNGVEAWETNNFKIFYPENYGREGLWPNIIGFFILYFGHEPWIPRIIAAIFGIFTVIGTYFLTFQLFSQITYRQISVRIIAFLAAFFIATSFWHINFSRIGFRAIMAPFFLVWGMYYCLKALNTNLDHYPSYPSNYEKKNKYSKTIIYSLLGGLFYGLGFNTYIAYRATPILFFIVFLFYWLKEKQNRRQIFYGVFFFLISTFITAAPLGLYFLKNNQDFFGRTNQISIFNSPTPLKNLGINIIKTIGMFYFSGDQNWRHNIAGKPLLFWPINLFFTLGLILSIYSIIRKKIFECLPFIILLSWIIIVTLPVIISNEGIPHALRAILMIPPIFILAGYGGFRFFQYFVNLLQFKTKSINKFFLFIVAIILIQLIIQTYYSYFIVWGQNTHVREAFNENYVQIGRLLNLLPREIPKYVIVEANGVLVRGIPMPAQTVMFITDTFTDKKQKEKNIFYILPAEKNQIPPGSYITTLR
jgi:hypothetical protein